MMSFFLCVCEEHLSCHRNYGEQNHEFSAVGIFLNRQAKVKKASEQKFINGATDTCNNT